MQQNIPREDVEEDSQFEAQEDKDSNQTMDKNLKALI